MRDNESLHTTSYESTNIVNDGNWHCIIFTFDGIVSKTYLDGIIENTASNNDFENLETSIDYKLGVMDDKGLLTKWFDGKIHDVRIYNRALSESEIQALYHEGGWDQN